MNPPNIVLIVTDQQTAGALGSAGNSWLSTPGMDQLARGGVRFRRAYCTNPLCVPSRMSLMTGRTPLETGVTHNLGGGRAEVRAPMLGRWLADAGYDCGYAGKWHLTTLLEDVGKHGFSWLEGGGRDNGGDADVPGSCEKFLRKARQGPFFLAAMFINPHNICEWARGQALPDGAIGDPPPPEQCPPLPENFEPAPAEPSVLTQEVRPLSPEAYPTADWTADKWRQYLWAYYRMVEKVDAGVLRILQALRDSGHERDTLVICTSDHGDGVAAHRWNQKQALYEEVVRVPLILRPPGAGDGGGGGEVGDDLVSMNLDLFPTICDYAGVPAPAGLPGVSLRPAVETPRAGPGRRWLFAETEFCVFNRPFGISGRMVRSDRFKYTVYSRGENREQFHDLVTDPGETGNLVGIAEWSAPVAEHRAALLRWCQQRDDPFLAVFPSGPAAA